MLLHALCVYVKKAAEYKELGCMLCVCMFAGCLVQGTGLHALFVCLQAAWYKEQGCVLCVCRLPGTRSRGICFVSNVVQAAWYKEQGCVLCVCWLPGTRTSLYALCIMCVQVV